MTYDVTKKGLLLAIGWARGSILKSSYINVFLASLACMLSACGQDEATSSIAEVKTPSPPVPSWSIAMIGKPLKTVTTGTANCKGALDVVTVKHTGAHPGSEIEGWGWDVNGRKPLSKVLFVNDKNFVVGAAAVGRPRPDVPKALKDVTTEAVGWKGVSLMVQGQVAAIGVTATEATCPLGSSVKL